MPEQWLRPPVEVMRPVRAALVPAEDAMAGRALYKLKLDGVRALAFRLPEGMMLQGCFGTDLAERWNILTGLLRDVAPPVQLVMATRERATAMLWFEHLAPMGIEGVVAKPLAGGYGGSRRLKVRHSQTVDGEAVALLVRTPDGRTVATTPILNAMQAHQIAAVAAALLGDDAVDPEHGPVHLLTEPLTVELLLGTGRHGTARFMRVRGE